MRKSSAQLFSGASLGLMLGFLLGLSGAPVVAVVVGAMAALLGSIVLPKLPTKSPADEVEETRAGIDLRGGALGLACVLGILCGIWLRTHDALSPKPPSLNEKLEQWKAIGFSPEEARVLVARSAGLGTTAPSLSTAATPKGTVLFGEPIDRCTQLAAGQFASIDVAASAYEALGEPALARVARGLSQLPDPDVRMKALTIVVEASCKGA